MRQHRILETDENSLHSFVMSLEDTHGEKDNFIPMEDLNMTKQIANNTLNTTYRRRLITNNSVIKKCKALNRAKRVFKNKEK